MKIKIRTHITGRIVLYECECWSFNPREENRLRGSENGVLQKIYAPRGEEVTGDRR